MEEGTADYFHDHSTFDGRLSLLLHRIKWKYVLPVAFFVAAFVGMALLLGTIEKDLADDNNSTMKKGLLQFAPAEALPLVAGENGVDMNDLEGADEEEKIHTWTVIKEPKPGVVEADGCENGLYAFEGFPDTLDVANAKSLKIRNLVIDAPALTHALGQWTSLEDLVIENVWVSGNFSRVYLPALKKFIFHQFRNGKTDQYKQQETLKQTIFFEKSPTQTWDLNKDLLNINVTVQVTVEGTKILDVEPERGEININTHECQDMLQNFKPQENRLNLSSLSLSWCPVGAPFLAKIKENAATLNYLFLNNAVPGSTADLAQVTSSLRNLKELHIFQRFHCDWPGYEIFLNVSDAAASLETLSVTNLDISFVPDIGAPSVKNLSLDQYVGQNVADNFDTIFPNLQTVALFNVTQNRSYPLLQKVLRRVRPELIIVTDFARALPPNKQQLLPSSKLAKSRTVAAEAVVIRDVEGILTASGVPLTATNFLLEVCKDKNATYIGKELTSFQKNFYRFVRLAFKKVDTYTDYVIWDAEPK